MKKGYVSQDKAPWLRYALEKRVITLITLVPLIILGLLIAPPATCIGFFIAFYSLRTYTNGYHAKSVGKCFLYSMLGEFFFLKIFPLVLNNITSVISLSVAIILIWILAPYNSTNMNLSSTEAAACAKSAKLRLSLLLLLIVLLGRTQSILAQGILLGIVMTASLLGMAYILQ